ncbi:hypothetical protein LZ554_003397 [Drepanopeziza brunnea f. sp. 'monogermtubi']|nr:hypothetical protein LZ554_003397 [Drepanopeziza brunnea f. sp. 'monogermtubi']
MATQYTTDIPISSSHTQQAFKLLELPPELLSLLESENPPTLTITSSASTTSSTTPSYAILTHGTNQYQMRQKNTSNPLLILQPSRTGPTHADDADGFVSQPSVTAVAKIEDTLELILQEEAGPGAKKKEAKVNKWHEKFARSRAEGKR